MQLYVFSQNLHLHSRDYKNPLKMTPYPLVRRGGYGYFLELRNAGNVIHGI